MIIIGPFTLLLLLLLFCKPIRKALAFLMLLLIIVAVWRSVLT